MLNENYKVEAGGFGDRLVLTSAWQSHYLDELLNYNVAEIVLNSAKGWKRTGLEFLLLFPCVKSLSIADWDLEDVSMISSLKNLRELDLNVICKIDFDFSIFPHLESCIFQWTKGMQSIFKCKQLKRIFINQLPERDFTKFSGFRQLEWLSLKSPKLHTLEGISELKSLKFLGIYLAIKLESVAGLEKVPQLTRLEIDTCRRVSQIEPIALLKKLAVLHLSNEKDIASLQPLRDLPQLEEVLLLESTNILDGDMSVFESLPKLKKLFFLTRKHYSHRVVDFPQYIYAKQ